MKAGIGQMSAVSTMGPFVGQYRLRVRYGPGAEDVRGRRDQASDPAGTGDRGASRGTRAEYEAMTGAKVIVATCRSRTCSRSS